MRPSRTHAPYVTLSALVKAEFLCALVIALLLLLASVPAFPQQQKLSAADAKDRVGETATVCGKVVAEVRGDLVAVLSGNGDGTFQGELLFSADQLPFQLAVGDFNGDGKPDIVVANQGSNDITILLNATVPWVLFLLSGHVRAAVVP